MHQINRERALAQPDERLDRQQTTHDTFRVLHADDKEPGEQGEQQKATAVEQGVLSGQRERADYDGSEPREGDHVNLRDALAGAGGRDVAAQYLAQTRSGDGGQGSAQKLGGAGVGSVVDT